MEWQVKYEPQTRKQPWNVYQNFNGQHIFKQGFLTEEEARAWAVEKERHHASPQGEKVNKVDEASIESFPASDAPAWTQITAKPDTKKKNK